MSPPIVWSISGTDSGGGAGLSADQRAADAFGVHLCPVVAAVTAQHSRAVMRVEAMPVALLEAQLQALAEDMPPAVIKTGLLGSADAVRCVARWVDRWRSVRPLALVIDPVLGASTGAAFADDTVLQAYREWLLPRATVITPNRREAARLIGISFEEDGNDDVPTHATRLRSMGAQAVCITGGDSADCDGHVIDWIDSELARGWLAGPRIATPHRHGTGCTFASSLAAALALGHVPADAMVLAKMATAAALQGGHAAGGGAGPVIARAGFHLDPALLPRLSWDASPVFASDVRSDARPLGLYAIVDSAERLQAVLDAGVRSVQLRIKSPPRPNDATADWQAALRHAVLRSVEACRAVGAELFINDHWALAVELKAAGVHLGQEDLMALGDTGRAALRRSGLALGISSHSLWELCRARTLSPRYIACGPVWPTTTKAMPWRAQGTDNLRWWCRVAGTPVVAIGGILEADQVAAAAACGADGVCIVRGLGAQPSVSVPPLLDALHQGQESAGNSPAIGLPHACLPRPGSPPRAP